MQTFFRNTQKGCDTTATSLTTSIRDKLEVYVEIPSTEQLRSAHKTSNEEKIQLWDQVKIGTFTRAVSAIYAVSLSLIFLRTEVNILGRYLYLDFSIPSQSEQEQINQETQKKYLSMYEYFLNTGLKELCEFTRRHATEELAGWPLARKLTLEDVLIIFANIRSRIEGINGNSVPLYQFLLPAEDKDADTRSDDRQLSCLLNETRDVLESDQFNQVLKGCLETSYTLMADNMKEAFASSSPISDGNNNNGESTTAVGPTVLPMPKILPLIRTRCKNMLEVAPQQDARSSLV